MWMTSLICQKFPGKKPQKYHRIMATFPIHPPSHHCDTCWLHGWPCWLGDCRCNWLQCVLHGICFCSCLCGVLRGFLYGVCLVGCLCVCLVGYHLDCYDTPCLCDCNTWGEFGSRDESVHYDDNFGHCDWCPLTKLVEILWCKVKGEVREKSNRSELNHGTVVTWLQTTANHLGEPKIQTTHFLNKAKKSCSVHVEESQIFVTC